MQERLQGGPFRVIIHGAARTAGCTREENMRRSLAILVLALVVAGCCSKPKAEREADQAAPAPPEGPAVVLVDPDNYDRVNSRALVRRVLWPTLANMDFAAYDSNIITIDPKMYEPQPPEGKVGLADLDFGGALEKTSLVDRLDETPLTDAEKGSPMAWLPMKEFLVEWDFDKATALEETGGTVSGEKWNDDDIPVSYQELSRAYLHAAEGGRTELWVRVEFKPWVKFLEGVDDEDGDGFPEYYGRVPQEVISEELVRELAESYRGKALSEEELKTWAYELGSYWYNGYLTETLWPDEEAEGPASRDGKLTVIIVGRPFEEDLYNVFLVENLASP